MAIVSSSLDPENTFRVLGTMPQNVNFAVKSSLVKNMTLMFWLMLKRVGGLNHAPWQG